MIAKFLQVILYLIVATIIGVILGSAGLSGPSWEVIGSVPGTPLEVFYTFPHIYVRTSDTLTYTCDERHKICSPVTSEPPVSTSSDRSYCYPSPEMPPTSGTIAASFAMRECAADGYVELYVSALEDGTVWLKRDGGSAFSGLFPFVCGAVGGIIGLTVGVVVVWRSSRQTPNEKAKRGIP